MENIVKGDADLLGVITSLLHLVASDFPLKLVEFFLRYLDGGEAGDCVYSDAGGDDDASDLGSVTSL